MNRVSVTLSLLAAVLCGAAAARADMLDIPASMASKVASTGQHNFPFDTNYLVGNIPSVNTYRNYFFFDLAAIPANHDVTSAVLFLEQPLLGYLSPDASETYELFNVTTPPADFQALYNPGDPTGLAIYADLGDGTSLGSAAVTVDDEESLVEVVLNAAALQLINQAGGGTFIVGGVLATLEHGIDVDERIFGFTGDNHVHFLRVETIEIPEPSGIVIGGAGAALVGLWSLRRRSRGRTAGNVQAQR
jgi:hypothetical protein